MDKDQIARIVCYAIGCFIAVYILLALLPYVILFFAIMGAGYLFHEYEKKNRRNRH